MKNLFLILATGLFFYFSCSSPTDFEPTDAGDDTNTDTETSTGADSDTDTDTDADTDADADTDTDIDTDTDTDSDSDTDTDTDTDSDDVNYCLALDGDGDYVEVPSDDILLLGSTWTLEAWAKQNTADSNQLLFRKNGAITDESSYFLYIAPTFQGGYNIGNAEYIRVEAENETSLNEWHHLALTNDGAYLRLFVDGALAAEQSSNDTPPEANSTSFLIGTRQGADASSTYYLDGSVDEVRISSISRYTSAFTPQRTFTLDADTLALWHFDEGSGAEVTDSASQLVGELNGDAAFFECDF